jgi:hypothetical protein
MVVKWGIAGLIIIIWGSYKIIKLVQDIYYFRVLRKLEMLIAMLIFLLPFSGNPFNNRPLSLALILFGFLISDTVVSINKATRIKDIISG